MRKRTKEDARSRRSTKAYESKFSVTLVARGVERLQELQGEGWFECYAFWVNLHGVNEPGGVRVIREDDRGVTEGREDVREVFQQRRSGAKRKLSRCGRNQLGNEPILALPEGADDFVVYYDARSKDLEACLEKGRSEFDFEAKYHLGKANVDVVPWSRKKE
ncbi:hypothetical protein Tco_0530556 [Tanacetum coccineum]